jgi:hypothetical protein
MWREETGWLAGEEGGQIVGGVVGLEEGGLIDGARELGRVALAVI